MSDLVVPVPESITDSDGNEWLLRCGCTRHPAASHDAEPVGGLTTRPNECCPVCHRYLRFHPSGVRCAT